MCVYKYIYILDTLPFLCRDGKFGDYVSSFFCLPLFLSLSLWQVSITLNHHRLDTLSNKMSKEQEACSFIVIP